MMGLTQRQRECLGFIRTHVKEKGVAPLVDEIRVALGYANKGCVSRLLDDLVARGAISRVPTIRRGIKLVPPKYDHGADCLCERCPARRLQYQQFVQALKVTPPISLVPKLKGLKPVSPLTAVYWRSGFSASMKPGKPGVQNLPAQVR